MTLLLEILVAVLILAGGLFSLIGSIGIARLPDFFTRLHGPSKATTLGVGSLLLASALYFTFLLGKFSVHEFLIALFIAITTPISAHLMGKAGLHRRVSGSDPYHELLDARESGR